MCWNDIAMLMFCCVAANHMGLIEAAEQIAKFRFPVIGCVKCSTFWSVLCYCSFHRYGMIQTVAVSFLMAFLAVWLELLWGFVDTLYMKIYGTIFSTESSGTEEEGTAHPEDALPDVPEIDNA